ncbi:hypothetical protein [Flammeovirga yaeyamensis]
MRYANNKEELYDHKKDPFEKNNVAKDKKYKAIKAKLSMLLDNEIYPTK